MGRVDELVTGDVNIIASKEIRQFFVADLKEAKKQLEVEGRTNTIRYECILKELQRRRDYNMSRYDHDTPRGKGFTNAEWEDFSRRWREACDTIKKYTDKNRRGKIRVKRGKK